MKPQKLISLILMILTFHSTFAKADIHAVHGMLLFGSETTYASHLPMFHQPHDYQVIMKLELVNIPRSQTLKIYEDYKKRGEIFFTLVPERMDLTQIISGEKTTFAAFIYLGHFERGGQNLGPIDVVVDLIIFSKKLNGFQPQVNAHEYLVFGEKGEYFAAHIINSKPSFDAILKVSRPYGRFFDLCMTRLCQHPSFSDDKLPLFLTDKFELPMQGGSLGNFYMSVDVKQVIYIEEAELRH